MLLFGCEGVQDAAETHFFDSRKTATILILDWAPFLLDDICSPTKLCKGSKGIFQSNTLGNPMLAAHMLPASIQIEVIVLLGILLSYQTLKGFQEHLPVKHYGQPYVGITENWWDVT